MRFFLFLLFLFPVSSFASETSLDFYQILGIEKTSSLAKINKAYRSLAVTSHPDKVPTDNEEEKNRVTSRWQNIQYVYNVLKDPNNRQVYDIKCAQLDFEAKVDSQKNLNLKDVSTFKNLSLEKIKDSRIKLLFSVFFDHFLLSEKKINYIKNFSA